METTKHNLSDEVLITADMISRRVTEMASQIDNYYTSRYWYSQTDMPVVVIGILSGSIFFMSDLVRRMSIRTEIDFIGVSTYPGKSMKPTTPKITSVPSKFLANSHVLLVDDILDTGVTMSTVRRFLWGKSVASITDAFLLRKPDSIISTHNCDSFIGFDIPDKFVVGYGLDFDNRYRELPDIRVIGD